MFRKLSKDRPEEGQGLVEYALILVLVSITVIVVLSLLGDRVGNVFVQVDTVLSGQNISGSGTEYVVGRFSASSSGGGLNCTVQTSSFTVSVLQNGAAVGAGQNVSISASASGGSAVSASATTDASGQATFNSVSMSGNCSGNVTVTAGSNSRSVGY